jgi:hypothetical protein
MKELIQALEIYSKYLKEDEGNPMRLPDDGIMYIHIDPRFVSMEDMIKLYELGFKADETMGYFYSYRHGR